MCHHRCTPDVRRETTARRTVTGRQCSDEEMIQTRVDITTSLELLGISVQQFGSSSVLIRSRSQEDVETSAQTMSANLIEMRFGNAGFSDEGQVSLAELRPSQTLMASEVNRLWDWLPVCRVVRVESRREEGWCYGVTVLHPPTAIQYGM